MNLILYSSDPDPGAARDRSTIARQLARLPPLAPVVILVHGYGYAPAHPGRNPADFIYARQRSGGQHQSWPWHLGFGSDETGADRTPALVIGFAWNARGTIWQAARRVEQAACELACLIGLIRRIDPTRRVTALAHSMGAAVVLAALPDLQAGELDRAVLMSAAILRHHARRFMATPAGSTAEIVNVTSRENDLFDFGIELALAGGMSPGLSQGIGFRLPNWADVQIDHNGALRGLAALGFPIAPPLTRICHWSTYSRPGIFALYRALLTDPAPLAFDRLVRALPDRQDPRWSRLFSIAPAFPPLPFRRGASS